MHSEPIRISDIMLKVIRSAAKRDGRTLKGQIEIMLKTSFNYREKTEYKSALEKAGRKR